MAVIALSDSCQIRVTSVALPRPAGCGRLAQPSRASFPRPLLPKAGQNLQAGGHRFDPGTLHRPYPSPGSAADAQRSPPASGRARIEALESRAKCPYVKSIIASDVPMSRPSSKSKCRQRVPPSRRCVADSTGRAAQSQPPQAPDTTRAYATCRGRFSRPWAAANTSGVSSASNARAVCGTRRRERCVFGYGVSIPLAPSFARSAPDSFGRRRDALARSTPRVADRSRRPRPRPSRRQPVSAPHASPARWRRPRPPARRRQ
jgi:hypothetical protein